MTLENTSAPMRDIPVPPGGGSWRFDEALWTWVSNDPVPADEPAAAAVPATTNATEEEQ